MELSLAAAPLGHVTMGLLEPTAGWSVQVPPR
jgi:hypothetical protein